MYLRNTTLLRICGYYTCDCCVIYPITLWYAIWPGGSRLPKYGLSQDWAMAGASSAKDMEAPNDSQRALGNMQNCQSQLIKKSLHSKSLQRCTLTIPVVPTHCSVQNVIYEQGCIHNELRQLAAAPFLVLRRGQLLNNTGPPRMSTHLAAEAIEEPLTELSV